MRKEKKAVRVKEKLLNPPKHKRCVLRCLLFAPWPSCRRLTTSQPQHPVTTRRHHHHSLCWWWSRRYLLFHLHCTRHHLQQIRHTTMQMASSSWFQLQINYSDYRRNLCGSEEKSKCSDDGPQTICQCDLPTLNYLYRTTIIISIVYFNRSYIFVTKCAFQYILEHDSTRPIPVLLVSALSNNINVLSISEYIKAVLYFINSLASCMLISVICATFHCLVVLQAIFLSNKRSPAQSLCCLFEGNSCHTNATGHSLLLTIPEKYSPQWADN